MTYKEYPDLSTTYVIIRVTGNGVVEDPFITHEAINGSEDLVKAQSMAASLIQRHNTEEALNSTWLAVRYRVGVNTCTPKGKELLASFEQQFNANFEKVKFDPRYKRYETADGHEMYLQHSDVLDGKRDVNNMQIIKDFMEKSPIHQLLVIDSMCRLTKKVLADTDRVRKQMHNHIISPEAWIQIAKEWAGIAQAYYKFDCYPKDVEDGKVVSKTDKDVQ